ncbi:uncharacterized protein LOC128377494 [Scomber scombrus]|uniref:Uncharacterized protein LOC128377494 n=1 Tax=Scomber scombrus TaxID=13677 RepID=A0AAV1PKL2_SCOSC
MPRMKSFICSQAARRRVEEQQRIVMLGPAMQPPCGTLAHVPYIHLADNFPTGRLQLGSRDGVHLSDEYGMPVLADLLWNAAYTQLATPPPEPWVPRRTSAVPRHLPQVVVKGEIV